MKLRAPAYPLINIDPYFSVWSPADRLTDTDTVHWTGRPNTISGVASIDGKEYRVIGACRSELPAMKQVSVDCSSFSTEYVFEENGARITLTFTSAVLPDDLELLSRPVSFLEIKYNSADRRSHKVNVTVSVSEEICMNRRGDSAVCVKKHRFGDLSSVSVESADQKVLSRSGDDLRIEWGTFYLSGKGKVSSYRSDDGMTFVSIETAPAPSALVTLSYDDGYSIEYFGKKLRSYWNRNGAKISEKIREAHADYRKVLARCKKFDDALFIDAVKAGGEKYAELLQLAVRQAVAAHKIAVDGDGQVLFISKECYSNGCAATVDVSYPSTPFFLLYNPELVKGMMRPIYKFAASDGWKFDFAPHDCGKYPLLNGQVYANCVESSQMPVEECGNMIIMEACVAIASKDVSFAKEHMDFLDKWVGYLVEHGRDPENQLCTDDFAGHLAHNCNLSLKAIMGIAGYGIIKGMCGQRALKNKYLKLARRMAEDWALRASNGDGSYRLAFDRPGSFSMKYNIVWDKLFGTDLMPAEVVRSEAASYRAKEDVFGLPLDNRETYTKSDWLVWTATLAPEREDFEEMVGRLWDAYDSTPSRVPMTDWYWTKTSLHRSYTPQSEDIEKSFRNRTVIGGLFIKLLEYRGTVRL